MSQRGETVSKWSREAEENYQAFLALLGQKALMTVEGRMGVVESDAAQGYGKSWKRLAGMLARLAPVGIESVGKLALKFHIPDGKYRQQVFALEESEGAIRVYLPDVTTAAIERKILVGPEGDGATYKIVGGSHAIELESITSDTQNLPAFCKAMLGWGRKALKVTLSPIADEGQMRVVERLCELAAEGWAGREQVAPVAAK